MLSRLWRPNIPFTAKEKTTITNAPESPAQNTFLSIIKPEFLHAGRWLKRSESAARGGVAQAYTATGKHDQYESGREVGIAGKGIEGRGLWLSRLGEALGSGTE